jgi:hypothetical protein
MPVLTRAGAVLLTVSLSAVAAPAPRPTAEARVAAAAEALMARFPQEQLNRAAGFFGPVVKKYLPTVKAFHREYAAATDRMAVIARYAPALDAALADARKMKVPPRYEKEKADYLRLAEAFVFSLKALVAMGR